MSDTQPTEQDPTQSSRRIEGEGSSRSVEVEWPDGYLLSGRYRIQRRIGSGGMAEVFLADDLFLRKPVAVKALRPSVAAKARNVERFRKEVALAHTVTHPNAVRIYDLGEDDGILFISMEYLEGESLQEKLTTRRRLPLEEVRSIALRTCMALEAAHRARVIHRDLKPSNIMIVDDPRRVVVMDFGISGISNESARPDDAEPFNAEASDWSVTSSGLGTLKYMPPEQVMRKPCGPPADIYSLGAILFRALTGQHIFKRGEGSYAFAHLKREPPRLRSIEPSIPRSIDEVVDRCLRKDPAARFQTAADLAEALRPQRSRNLGRFGLRVLGLTVLVVLVTFGVMRFAEAAIITEMRPAVARLAELTATSVTAAELDSIRGEGDMEGETFHRIQEHFDRIQARNPEVESIYTLRRLEADFAWEFVVDVDPWPEDKDGNGAIEGPNEEGVVPGDPYDSTTIPGMTTCLETGEVVSDRQFLTDEYGYTLSGYAPIGDQRGPGGYILGVDVGNERLVRFRRVTISIFAVAWLVLVTFTLLAQRRAGRMNLS